MIPDGFSIQVQEPAMKDFLDWLVKEYGPPLPLGLRAVSPCNTNPNAFFLHYTTEDIIAGRTMDDFIEKIIEMLEVAGGAI